MRQPTHQFPIIVGQSSRIVYRLSPQTRKPFSPRRTVVLLAESIEVRGCRAAGVTQKRPESLLPGLVTRSHQSCTGLHSHPSI